jgi:hypothetical protein
MALPSKTDSQGEANEIDELVLGFGKHIGEA